MLRDGYVRSLVPMKALGNDTQRAYGSRISKTPIDRQSGKLPWLHRRISGIMSQLDQHVGVFDVAHGRAFHVLKKQSLDDINVGIVYHGTILEIKC